MTLALVDIGSAAARVELYATAAGQPPRVLWKHKARTGLSEHTSNDGAITARGVDQCLAAVEECARALKTQEPDTVVAFVTSAVRDAPNGSAVREELQDRTGLRIGSLSPEREAAVTYYAAHRWFGWSAGPLTTVDIGGGRMEISAGAGEEPDEVLSLPMGAMRLTREFLPDDPPALGQVEELATVCAQRLRQCGLTEWHAPANGRCVGVSKVLRQLARLTSSDREGQRRPRVLRYEDLVRWVPRLARLDSAGRADLPGISRNRARRSLAGAVVAEAVMRALGTKSLHTCPWSLREGLVLRFGELAAHAARTGTTPPYDLLTFLEQ